MVAACAQSRYSAVLLARYFFHGIYILFIKNIYMASAVPGYGHTPITSQKDQPLENRGYAYDKKLG
jgi:hypothetical protein